VEGGAWILELGVDTTHPLRSRKSIGAGCAGDPAIGDYEIRWAIERVTTEVREVLLQMPARQAGTSRLDKILYKLDQDVRSQAFPQNA